MPLSKNNIFALLSSAAFGAYAVSVDRTILFWNRSAERILGYSSQEVLGRLCYEVMSGPAPGLCVPECEDGCPSVKSLQDGRMPRQASINVISAAGERKSVSVVPMIVGGIGEDPYYFICAFTEEPTLGQPDGGFTQASPGRQDSELGVGEGASVGSRAAGRVRRLTARELEVLRLVSMGWETRRIAGELNISPHTVLNHIRHFRRKLDAPTKLDAVVTAIRLGILPMG